MAEPECLQPQSHGSAEAQRVGIRAKRMRVGVRSVGGPCAHEVDKQALVQVAPADGEAELHRRNSETNKHARPSALFVLERTEPHGEAELHLEYEEARRQRPLNDLPNEARTRHWSALLATSSARVRYCAAARLYLPVVLRVHREDCLQAAGWLPAPSPVCGALRRRSWGCQCTIASEPVPAARAGGQGARGRGCLD